MATYSDFGDTFLIREQTNRQIVQFDRDQILPGDFTELVEFLVESGAEPNAGAHRFTPLIAAILRQNEGTVDLLLGAGADPNLPLGDFTPHQRGSTTDFFLHRASVGATPLWFAARFGTPRMVGQLLDHGADPLFVHYSQYYSGGQGGNLAPLRSEITTTLMAALRMGTGRAWTVVDATEEMVLETVKLLVQAGVDVNATGHAENRGMFGVSNALQAAVTLEFDSVAEFLLASGATPLTDARFSN
jgi:hypothetical protein